MKSFPPKVLTGRTKLDPAPKEILGEIVADWTEFGHRFQIEKLIEPRRVGNYLRYYRLWDNGDPATGGQWHYDEEGARRRADYLLSGDYSDRVRWLEAEVGRLTRELYQANMIKSAS